MADPTNDTDFFWQSKYNSTTVGTKIVDMVDGTDALANHGRQLISFQHVPSQREVYFKAFIVAYNESYNCDWSTEPVFGRTDPIYLFKGNQRQISLSFKVPASSEGEAYENLGRVQKLAQFLYPAYHAVAGTLSTTNVHANTIGQSPLVRLKVMNLLAVNQAQAASMPPPSEQQLYDGYMSTSEAEGGQLGAILSMQVNHNLQEVGVLEKGPNTILPKLMDITITFAVIHEDTIGWRMKEKIGEEGMLPTDTSFPYGATLKSDDQDPDSEGKYFNERIAEIQKDEQKRNLAQATLDNSIARYTSLGGKRRLKRDYQKFNEGKLSTYETERLVAYAGTDEGGDEIYDLT